MQTNILKTTSLLHSICVMVKDQMLFLIYTITCIPVAHHGRHRRIGSVFLL